MSEAGTRDAARDEPHSRFQSIMANAKTIGGAVTLALFIRVLLFEAFEIEGPSMEPTLLTGDRVVVAKFLYGIFLPFTKEAVATWGLPHAGDVIIVKSPRDDIDIVKRVIGEPGDRIQIRDDEVFRNGTSLRSRVVGPGRCTLRDGFSEEGDTCEWVEEHIGEHRWLTSHAISSAPEPTEAWEVPPGRIFVLGDHRDRSNDSRNPAVGFIPGSRIKGRALSIYWSYSGHLRWGRIFRGVR